MCQLPPDSHLATASQLTGEAADADPAVPSSRAPPAAPASRAPVSTRGKRARRCPSVRESIDQPPRLRGQLSGSARGPAGRFRRGFTPKARPQVARRGTFGSPAPANIFEVARPARGGIRRACRPRFALTRTGPTLTTAFAGCQTDQADT